jgi:ParB/RepB/Spo0J family partition protein
MKKKIAQINVDLIDPRGTISRDTQSIFRLTNSIKTEGLVVPLSVCPTKKGRFKVIYGDRRLRAIKKLGYKTVLCFIEPNQYNTLNHSVIENVLRSNIPPLQKIKICEELKSNGKEISEISEMTGWSIVSIEKYLKVSSSFKKNPLLINTFYSKQLTRFISDHITKSRTEKLIVIKDNKSISEKIKLCDVSKRNDFMKVTLWINKQSLRSKMKGKMLLHEEDRAMFEFNSNPHILQGLKMWIDKC